MQQAIVQSRKGRSRGFTLVELAIVVLVIGILAAVAAPKMVSTATAARSNGTKQSLAVIRSALEMYKSENGSYPPVVNNAIPALLPKLSGPFPIAQVGTNQNSGVAPSTADPVTVNTGAAFGWIYNSTTGEIRVNDADSLAW